MLDSIRWAGEERSAAVETAAAAAGIAAYWDNMAKIRSNRWRNMTLRSFVLKAVVSVRLSYDVDFLFVFIPLAIICVCLHSRCLFTLPNIGSLDAYFICPFYSQYYNARVEI